VQRLRHHLDFGVARTGGISSNAAPMSSDILLELNKVNSTNAGVRRPDMRICNKLGANNVAHKRHWAADGRYASRTGKRKPRADARSALGSRATKASWCQKDGGVLVNGCSRDVVPRGVGHNVVNSDVRRENNR
jgi:hypothetical protein